MIVLKRCFLSKKTKKYNGFNNRKGFSLLVDNGLTKQVVVVALAREVTSNNFTNNSKKQTNKKSGARNAPPVVKLIFSY